MNLQTSIKLYMANRLRQNTHIYQLFQQDIESINIKNQTKLTNFLISFSHQFSAFTLKDLKHKLYDELIDSHIKLEQIVSAIADFDKVSKRFKIKPQHQSTYINPHTLFFSPNIQTEFKEALAQKYKGTEYYKIINFGKNSQNFTEKNYHTTLKNALFNEPLLLFVQKDILAQMKSIEEDSMMIEIIKLLDIYIENSQFGNGNDQQQQKKIVSIVVEIISTLKEQSAKFKFSVETLYCIEYFRDRINELVKMYQMDIENSQVKALQTEQSQPLGQKSQSDKIKEKMQKRYQQKQEKFEQKIIESHKNIYSALDIIEISSTTQQEPCSQIQLQKQESSTHNASNCTFCKEEFNQSNPSCLPCWVGSTNSLSFFTYWEGTKIISQWKRSETQEIYKTLSKELQKLVVQGKNSTGQFQLSTCHHKIHLKCLQQIKPIDNREMDYKCLLCGQLFNMYLPDVQIKCRQSRQVVNLSDLTNYKYFEERQYDDLSNSNLTGLTDILAIYQALRQNKFKGRKFQNSYQILEEALISELLVLVDFQCYNEQSENNLNLFSSILTNYRALKASSNKQLSEQQEDYQKRSKEYIRSLIKCLMDPHMSMLIEPQKNEDKTEIDSHSENVMQDVDEDHEEWVSDSSDMYDFNHYEDSDGIAEAIASELQVDSSSQQEVMKTKLQADQVTSYNGEENLKMGLFNCNIDQIIVRVKLILDNDQLWVPIVVLLISAKIIMMYIRQNLISKPELMKQFLQQSYELNKQILVQIFSQKQPIEIIGEVLNGSNNKYSKQIQESIKISLIKVNMLENIEVPIAIIINFQNYGKIIKADTPMELFNLCQISSEQIKSVLDSYNFNILFKQFLMTDEYMMSIDNLVSRGGKQKVNFESLLQLETGWGEIHKKYHNQRCSLCGDFPKGGGKLTICLLCGDILCSISCDARPSKQNFIGNLNYHSLRNHEGVSLFLFLTDSSLITVSYPDNHVHTGLFCNKYGEEFKKKAADWNEYQLDQDELAKFYKQIVQLKLVQSIIGKQKAENRMYIEGLL